jgi:hypothetical protein
LWEPFLNEAPIVQEEAVFLGADMMRRRPDDSGAKVPRRGGLRKVLGLLQKGAAAGDVGPLRIERRGEYITLNTAVSRTGSDGFSLLIKEPGSYTLKNAYIIVAGERENKKSGQEALGPDGEQVFFALFPLVLRPCRRSEVLPEAGQRRLISDILKANAGDEKLIAAEDRKGLAAVIGAGEGRLLYRREKIPAAERIKIEPVKRGLHV